MDRMTYRDEKNRAFYKACENCDLPEKAYEAGADSPCDGCYQELVRCIKLADYEDAEEKGEIVRKSNIKKAIENAEQMHPCKIPEIPESYSDYSQGWKDACEWIFTSMNLQED